MNRDKVMELRVQGKTYQEIAELYGVSRQRVHQRLTGYKPKLTDKVRQWRKNYSREYQRGYRKTPTGKMLAANVQRKINTRSKELVLTHYGGGNLACVTCGYDDLKALSIDHINGNGSKHKKSIGMNTYRWLIKNNYPLGYQTLCMNCQWVKRHDNKECKRNDLLLNKG